MASNIPVIVQGNSFSLAIPLQIYYINGDQMDLQDYTPDPTDEVSVQLKGSRRNYTYTPTIDGNVANIDLSGNELADNYSVVVSIVKANGQRLRSFRTDQFFIVESSDDLTTDDIIQGLEENVIYLNSSIFVAGEDGRGIESIVKAGTSGLVDTYTITYSDNTTSTFTVTNGAAGVAGSSIATIEKTSTSGLVDTYTITLTNGDTTTFEVTNGMNGVDLGLANIVNGFEGGATNVLSAEAGKHIKENIQILLDALGNYAFPNGKPSLNWDLSLVSVVVQLTNVSSSNTDETAELGEAYTTTLTCSNISNLYVADVVVRMGGVDITSTAYTPSTGVVSIAEVTGNIEITATQITYIADGLVLNLDGKNRGGTAGHWVDLIGNNDFEIQGTFEENADNIDFKGSAFAVVEGVGSYTTLAATLEAVANQASWSSPQTYQPIAMSNCRGGIIVGTVLRSGSSYGYPSYCRAVSAANVTNYKSPDLDGSYTANNIHSIVRYGGNIKLDGVAKANTNHVPFAYPDSVTLGSFELGGYSITRSFNGKIYAVRLYGRVLTADEMAQNLKVDKLRFGF